MVQQKSVNIRPALIVGLGGSGKEVAMHLKAKVNDLLGSQTRAIKILSIDTDNRLSEVQTASGRRLRLDASEFKYVGGIDVRDVIERRTDKHTYIRSWFPKNLSTSAITDGAKQIRALGRFAYHFNWRLRSNLHNELDSAIRQLRAVALHQDERVDDSVKLNIFIISSLAGGTGSGMFLDIAYALRWLTGPNGLGMPEGHVFITGILILPQAFANKAGGNRIFANTFSALRELDFFMGEDSNYTVEYQNQPEISIQHTRPFNVCYLVDAVTENAQVMPEGMDALAPMLADYLLVHMTSAVGAGGEAMLDNVLPAMDNVERTDEGDYPLYSSLGMATLKFPAEELIRACGARLVMEMVECILDNPTLGGQQALQDFLTEQKLSQESIEELLRRDTTSKKLQQLTVAVNDNFEGVDNKQIRSSAEGRASRFEAEYLRGTFPAVIAANRHTAQQDLINSAMQKINALLDDVRGGGVKAAREFIQALDNALDEMVRVLNQRASDASEREKEQRNAAAKRLEAMRTIGGLGAGGKLRTEAQAYIKQKVREFTEVLIGIVAAESAAALTGVRDDLKVQLNRVITLENNLQAIANADKLTYNQMYNNTYREKTPFVRYITDAKDLEGYYKQFAPDPRSLISRAYNDLQNENGKPLGSPSTWGNAYEPLKRALADFGSAVFAPIASIHLEDVIQQKSDQVAPDDRLIRLLDLAKPFWNPRQAELRFVQPLTVVGVENRQNTLFGGQNLAQTNNPHEIVVVNTKHGMSLRAIPQYETWEKIYKHMRQERRENPLHAFNLDSEENKQWFALALAFGFITQRTAYYYFNPDPTDQLVDEIQLGNGLQTAVQRFMMNTRWVGQARDAVEAHATEIGSRESRALIDQYINSPFPDKPEERRALEKELRQLARGYAQNL